MIARCLFELALKGNDAARDFPVGQSASWLTLVMRQACTPA